MVDLTSGATSILDYHPSAISKKAVFKSALWNPHGPLSPARSANPLGEIIPAGREAGTQGFTCSSLTGYGAIVIVSDNPLKRFALMPGAPGRT